MYKLFWGAGSAAFAPQAVMEEAEIPHERIPVDFRANETRNPKFLAINPAGYVPALITETEEVIYESAAIVLYLCDRHALESLAPAPQDPQRGLFLRSIFYLTNTVQECYKHYYYADRYSNDPAATSGIKEQAVENLIERWKLVDDHLASHGPYHLGEGYSAADIYMAMLVTWFQPIGDLRPLYPAIDRCFSLLEERPAMQRVLASHETA